MSAGTFVATAVNATSGMAMMAWWLVETHQSYGSEFVITAVPWVAGGGAVLLLAAAVTVARVRGVIGRRARVLSRRSPGNGTYDMR